MKKLISLFILLPSTLILTSCTSVEKQLADAIAFAGTLGDVEYQRTGFWTDSALTVHVEEDNTRTVEYEARVKAPGGPAVRIKVGNIPHNPHESEPAPN